MEKLPEELPEEVLEMIFIRAHSESKLVCRKWYRIAPNIVIQNIPIHILEIILKKVDPGCMLVCKHWYHIIKNRKDVIRITKSYYTMIKMGGLKFNSIYSKDNMIYYL